ncbi:hypothetical protein [Mucilaginibacter frigoritolerans]|uniref:hypothetical protein n=1 Tax=Mucilaginibacter frigoritolerans TaxID=652788 RepID=UPI0011A065D9|nr:hypothetical protein [Mucilaginibacter frigoritolerans]
MHFLISIEIIPAIISIVLILVLKTPLKTSDKLLLAILACFAIKFSRDEVSSPPAIHFSAALPEHSTSAPL